jgi:hypothetical protein
LTRPPSSSLRNSVPRLRTPLACAASVHTVGGIVRKLWLKYYPGG